MRTIRPTIISLLKLIELILIFILNKSLTFNYKNFEHAYNIFYNSEAVIKIYYTNTEYTKQHIFFSSR